MTETIGTLIEQKVKERGIPKTEFARRIHRSKSLIDDIYMRKSIDIDLLKLIGKALDYDFLPDYFKLSSKNPNIAEPGSTYGNKDLDACREEVNRLLRENNQILNQLVNVQNELLKFKAPGVRRQAPGKKQY